MTSNQEAVPSQSVIEAVVEQEVAPVISKCEESLGFQLSSEIVVMCKEVEHGFKRIGDGEVRGKIRITFRNTFHEDRLRFHVEAIYGDLQTCGGFSGFTINGKVTLDENDVRVEGKGGAYRHNVWQWQGT